MLYSLTTDFTKLNETQGTVQNSSNIYTLELSDSDVPDSGVLIFPLNKLSFTGTKFLRCIDGTAQARVVAFSEVTNTGASSSISPADTNDDDFSDVLNNIFNGNSSP